PLHSFPTRRSSDLSATWQPIGRRNRSRCTPRPSSRAPSSWPRQPAEQRSPRTASIICAATSNCCSVSEQNRHNLSQMETRNEKAQDFRTHLAGRRNLGRRRRLPLRRLDSTLSHPRWRKSSPRSVRRELRSAAWPAHLRSLVGLLAEGAEQSYV